MLHFFFRLYTKLGHIKLSVAQMFLWKEVLA